MTVATSEKRKPRIVAQRWTELGLVIVAGLLTIALGWQWFAFSSQQQAIRELAGLNAPTDTGAIAESDGENVEFSRTDSRSDERPESELYKRLTKRISENNVFSTPGPQGFQGKLTGILGNKAIFSNDESAGVGDRVMGARVLRVGADWAEIEFEGDERRLWVFDDHEGDQGERRDGAERRRSDRPQRAARPMRGRGSGPGNGPGGAPGGEAGRGSRDFGEMRERMIERFQQMSPEQQQAILERMPPEVAERVRERLAD